MRNGGFEIEHADELVLKQKGNDKFGAHAVTCFAMNVARLKLNIGNANRFAIGGGAARNTFTERNTEARGNGVLVVHGEDAFEELSLFIPKHDGEDVVVDELLDVRGNAAQERFAVENGRKFAADVIEKRESLGLLGEGKKKRLRNRVGFGEEG